MKWITTAGAAALTSPPATPTVRTAVQNGLLGNDDDPLVNDDLDIRVLGDFAVLRGGGAVALPQSRKTRALLAYLAVTARRHQRERLCEIFWETPDDPRGALRWSMSKLRQIVGSAADAFSSDRNAVELRLGTSVDYARFATAVRGDMAGLSIGELEAAANLVRGQFLADLHLERCPEYEAWRIAVADEVAVGEVRLLREVVGRLKASPGRALPYAQRLRAAMPDDTAIAREVEALSLAARADAARPAASGAETPGPALTSEPHEPAAPTAERRPTSQDRDVRFCKAHDGVRLAYSLTGQGPPIVRAAHWMSHLRYEWESPIWRHWMAELSRDNTLLRYDERCNGLSDWDAADVSFDVMLSDLERVIDVAGVRRFTLLGISQSCALSVAYAVRHPERVSGLVLYGGYVKGWRKRGSPREIATREALATLMREGWGQNNPLFRQLFTSQLIRGAGPEHVAWIDELQRRTVSPENAWRLQNMFADIDVSDLLANVTVPTLVLHAREDAVAPVASGKTFAAEIPGARFVEFDSANHILLEDEPAFAEFMASVRSFVAETAR